MITSFGFSPADFRWAVGIEDTFIPQSRLGHRALDEYELMQHYRHWQADFDLAADAGAQMIRWGVPWYKVEPKPGQWDWRWVDGTLEYMIGVKGLTPILDLMHYGTPLWLDNSFINAHYAARVARYAGEFARRYGEVVKFYTPLNEPLVNAMMCGGNGQWPPYMHGLDGQIKLIIALAKGMCMTVEAIRAVQPEAQMVWVEAFSLIHTIDCNLVGEVERRDHMQYLTHDLVRGAVDESHPLYPLLVEHGVRQDDLRWLQLNRVALDILGCNFYPWSAGELVRRRDGRIRSMIPKRDGAMLAYVLRAAYDHYQVPLLVTETSAREGVQGRAAWMRETLGAVRQVREQGVPVLGYTWFPLFSMIDWKYRKGRRPLKDYLIHLGLYEVSCETDGTMPRRATDLVAQYRACTQDPAGVIGELHTAGYEFHLQKIAEGEKVGP